MISGHQKFLMAGGTSTIFNNNESLAAKLGEQLVRTRVDESGSFTTLNTTDDSIFGPVPARTEVQKAIHELTSFMGGLKSKMIGASGYERFHNAFSMMQKEPVVQNMVMSIACDKAVWQAILDNKAVQSLTQSIFPDIAKEKKLLSCTEESPDVTVIILKWIVDFAKSKVMELVEKFVMLVGEIFQNNPQEKANVGGGEILEEKIRSSMLLSVVILLIVVVARSQG